MSNSDLETYKQELMDAREKLRKTEQVLEMALNVIAEYGGQLVNWTSEFAQFGLPEDKTSEMTFAAGELYARMATLEKEGGLNSGPTAVKRRRRMFGLDEKLDIDTANLQKISLEPDKLETPNFIKKNS